MQLLDFKTKDLWIGKFKELKIQKCTQNRAAQEDSSKRNSAKCYSEVKKLAYGVADDVRVDIFVRASILLHEYNKK
ncbi:unnamed protein product [Larinioides sclopetarius]|uniref:Uncharacterized protein n=1 Tax=Larinioides sclopetarius TaxID=280406 RepID=A0AAV2A969_9ARAC